MISWLSAPSADSPGNIVVFDVASRKQIEWIDAGGGVGGILMRPDGARAGGPVTAIDDDGRRCVARASYFSSRIRIWRSFRVPG